MGDSLAPSHNLQFIIAHLPRLRKPLFFALEKKTFLQYNILGYPGVAQLVARLLWEQDAAGSNPVTRTNFLGKTAVFGGFSALHVQILHLELTP